VLRQFTTAHLLLGQAALASGDPKRALHHFTNAMETPPSLGEAYHLLQAKADVNYWIGRALRALGRETVALEHFEKSAAECGDFAEMAVTTHSPLSYHRGLSLRELGRPDEAWALFEELGKFARVNIGKPAVIDYFATSLPNLLVFEEDLQARRDAEHHLLAALACHGLGDAHGATSHLSEVNTFTNADQRAADLAAELKRQA
jgi:tetratricopeptide (TPR) repeat protein